MTVALDFSGYIVNISLYEEPEQFTVKWEIHGENGNIINCIEFQKVESAKLFIDELCSQMDSKKKVEIFGSALLKGEFKN